MLSAVVIGPEQAQYSVIWLHGLGADGHDFEPIVPDLNFTHKPKTRFIFPHAPQRPVTCNNGFVMPAWYDIFEIGAGARQDEDGLRESAQQISELIEREHQFGVEYQRICLAGFSQGGAVALYTGLRYQHRLAGIMGLSTYLPVHGATQTEANSANQQTPIFLAHGDYDQVVPLELGSLSKDYLVNQGYTVSWQTYPMAHSLMPEEITDISQWFEQVFK